MLSCLNGHAFAKDYTGSITVGSLKRTYRLHVPPLHDKAKQAPLVIALHGGGGTGKRMERLTRGGFNTLSDKEGFIVVYPDGIEKSWNDGRKDARSRSHKDNIDDVGFISALIDHLIKEFNIDSKRIYVTGASNGAIMSYRLACELPEKITAIAPVIGLISEGFSCPALSQPVSALIIAGTKDPLMPWEGGAIRFGRHYRGRVQSAFNTVNYWAAHNRCASPPVVTDDPDKDPKDGARVKHEVYNCQEGSEVILYTIEGGGHTWPDGYQYLPERIVGKASRDINANAVIWIFFKRHARK